MQNDGQINKSYNDNMQVDDIYGIKNLEMETFYKNIQD
jgi:hypothetical protein